MKPWVPFPVLTEGEKERDRDRETQKQRKIMSQRDKCDVPWDRIGRFIWSGGMKIEMRQDWRLRDLKAGETFSVVFCMMRCPLGATRSH